MAAPQLDIGRLAGLKAQIEKIAEARKAAKSQLDELEQRIADAMLKANVRFVDESGNGNGPFWTLCKDKKDGNWKQERYIEFFTTLLTELGAGKRFSPDQLAALAVQYLKQFEKRGLKVEKHTQARRKDCEDLKVWLAKGVEE